MFGRRKSSPGPGAAAAIDVAYVGDFTLDGWGPQSVAEEIAALAAYFAQ